MLIINLLRFNYWAVGISDLKYSYIKVCNSFKFRISDFKPAKRRFVFVSSVPVNLSLRRLGESDS